MTDRERIRKEFQTLISFDSESFHEKAITDYLERRLKELGLETERDRADELLGKVSEESTGNLYGYLPGVGESILFSSHTDTVSPGKGKKAILKEDGRITSDGTTVLGADDVAGLTAILEALTVIREQNLPHRPIEVLFPIAEEPYCQGTKVFDFSKIRSKISYTLDLTGLIGTAAFAAPSIIFFSVEVAGKAAHAGFAPEEGVNALTILAKALSQIQTGRLTPDTTLNFGTVEGGTASNIVPDRVIITGEVRSLSHEKALSVLKDVERVFTEQAERLGGSVKVTREEKIRSYETPLKGKAAKQFEKAVRKTGIHNGSAEFVKTFGGSDQNRFSKAGIEGLVLACGMEQVHSTREYTSLEALWESSRLVLELMTDLT